MFNLFKKKSEVQKLELQYNKLMEESFKLSHANRKMSDLKRLEAEKIQNQIILLNSKR